MTQDYYYARNDASAAGAMLAAAREEMNLSVSEVARHLKLSPAQVEALEEGAYERLPGRVFVRGFLRNYAKLLGVDPQPLLRRIEHEMPQPSVEEEPPAAPEAVMPTGERSRWPLYVGIAATIVAALAAYEFGFNNPPPGESPPSADGSRSEPAAGSETASPPAASAQGASAKSLPIGAAPQLPAAGTASAATGPLPSTHVQAGSAAAAKVQPGERELFFRFEQESWVEVRDRDNKVIFSKLNRAGSEERVAGTPPLKLVVGNARGVRLNMDDQAVDLSPHIKVAVARLTLE
jgi:cytoskeleton protein RodZ